MPSSAPACRSSARQRSSRRSPRSSPGSGADQTVWMSHRDSVTAAPTGARVVAGSPSTPIAAFEAPERGLYAVQFHPEVMHTHARHRGAEELPLQRRRGAARVDARCGDRGAGRAHPRPGRARAGSVRAVGRRRLGRRRAARAQGGRRPAHVRLRRPRASPAERGRTGRRDIRRPLPSPARACRSAVAIPVAARGRRRSGGEAEDRRRGVHPRLRGRGARARRRRGSSCRERSTRT